MYHKSFKSVDFLTVVCQKYMADVFGTHCKPVYACRDCRHMCVGFSCFHQAYLNCHLAHSLWYTPFYVSLHFLLSRNNKMFIHHVGRKIKNS